MRVVLAMCALLIALSGCAGEPEPAPAPADPQAVPSPSATDDAGDDQDNSGPGSANDGDGDIDENGNNDGNDDLTVEEFCDDVADYVVDVEEVQQDPESDDARELQADAEDIQARYKKLKKRSQGDPASLQQLESCHDQFLRSDSGP